MGVFTQNEVHARGPGLLAPFPGPRFPTSQEDRRTARGSLLGKLPAVPCLQPRGNQRLHGSSHARVTRGASGHGGHAGEALRRAHGHAGHHSPGPGAAHARALPGGMERGGDREMLPGGPDPSRPPTSTAERGEDKGQGGSKRRNWVARSPLWPGTSKMTLTGAQGSVTFTSGTGLPGPPGLWFEGACQRGLRCTRS